MIAGLQKMTLLDFPGKVACTVFLAGCNYRCPFCHNAELFANKPEEVMSTDEFLAFLKTRVGLLDGVSGFFSIVLGAFIGSMVVMGLILFFSTLIKSNIMLLITGIMIGYITSSAISLLNFFATAEGVHSYMIWGMGNFSGVSLEQMPYFAIFTLSGLTLAILLIKPLNALLLGTRYAENLGVNIKRTRNLLLIATGILTAVTTAFCGPVSFIGLAVPHIARLLLGTSNHNSLLPVTLLTGSAIALLCNLICILPGESGIIPLNAVTPVLGAPVIIYVIINQRRIQYFN